MKYQAHIDGLRAIAVLSVILFHLDIHWFKGGFVGVDVFFVISGYLITSIIVKEVNGIDGFSFKKFYTRRARRLLPALFSVFVICLTVALFLYSSERLFEFGTELIYSVLSAANFLFWIESGYFDAEADTKLLLHMWSLSVEEQFYLFWPLLLVVMYRHFSRTTIFVIGVGGFAVSLVVNVLLTNFEVVAIKNQSEMMFYLMPFRIYEFLIGVFGVWAFDKVPNNRLFREAMFWLGAGAIALSIAQYTAGMKFPYYLALLPCVGALCIILSKGSFSGKLLLENKLLVAIGLLSYTLYLVHWPVIVFYKYFRLVELSSIDKFIAVVITLAVTLVIYFYIEQPMRKPKPIKLNAKNGVSNERFLTGCLGLALAFLVVGFAFVGTSGLSQYKNELISEDALVEGKSRRYDLINQGCSMTALDSRKCNNNRPIQVLILGDSHEADGYNIFHSMFGVNSSVNLIRFRGTNNCDVEYTEKGKLFSSVKQKGCDKRVKKLNDIGFVRSLDVVVFSSNRPFTAYEMNAWSMLKHISKVNQSVKILVLGTYFNTVVPCSEIANRFNDLDQCKDPKYLSYVGNNELDNVHNFELVEDVDFTYLDKFSALCTTQALESCPVAANDEPMFYDRSHLSLGFAQYVGTQFLDVYSEQLKAAGFPVNSVSQ